MSSDVFSIIGSALNAQDMRLGAISSNLANAASVAKPGEQPYRAHELVFQAAPLANSDEAGQGSSDMDANAGVQIMDVVQSNAPPTRTYDPSSPNADSTGYVTSSNVSQVDEMVNMIDSSNSYSASVAMLQQTSRIDQQIINSFQVT